MLVAQASVKREIQEIHLAFQLVSRAEDSTADGTFVQELRQIGRGAFPYAWNRVSERKLRTLRKQVSAEKMRGPRKTVRTEFVTGVSSMGLTIVPVFENRLESVRLIIFAWKLLWIRQTALFEHSSPISVVCDIPREATRLADLHKAPLMSFRITYTKPEQTVASWFDALLCRVEDRRCGAQPTSNVKFRPLCTSDYWFTPSATFTGLDSNADHTVCALSVVRRQRRSLRPRYFNRLRA
jgi:hypothetical protein